MRSTKVAPISPPKQAKNQARPLNGLDLKGKREALKKENAYLKKEVATLKTEVSDLKKRKAPAAAAPAAEKAKTPAQRKNLFEKWAKAVARQSSKHKITNPGFLERYKAEVKGTVPWSIADFESIFAGGDGGKKIQPTSEKKPTS